MKEGPSLYRLMQRLAETPAVFTGTKLPEAAAVVSDLLADAGGDFLQPAAAAPFRPASARDTNRVQLLLLVCHLLHDDWFCGQQCFAQQMAAFLQGKKLADLAKLAGAGKFITNPERREELVRLSLDALGLVPEGEAALPAKDRLTTLDSVERDRLIRKTRQAQQRARELREAMARQVAEEAASKMSRE